ncbi:cell adhesion molecule [Echinococcus multilocularis]|uniref:Cell adhesion molecule n=1 Tax=Echinococcus multilocularis TaxID=6211 RepID=A0A068Y9P3_ECHMU|nr:cell adhesion molecule [Echinococcus multilocularis]
MVQEGGRIVLICCTLGNTSGHDHEQLLWTDSSQKPIINYFSNSVQAAQSRKYAVPDFSDRKHIISRLVVQDFNENDKGTYTCSRKSTITGPPNPTPAKVDLIMRPRLLADFTSLSRTETDEVVMTGYRVSVPLEEGLEGGLVCRTNPTFNGPVRVTWFYHGRQLIGPAASMSEEFDLPKTSDHKESKKNRQRKHQTRDSTLQMGGRGGSPLKKLSDAVFRPAVVDPAELGVSLENNSQVLKFTKLTTRHAGMYMCKAEAPNPVYHAPTPIDQITQALFSPPSTTSSTSPATSTSTTTPNPFDPSVDSGINTEFLVQVQPIRLIVFSRPRMLPGNPRLVNTNPSTSPPPHNSWTTRGRFNNHMRWRRSSETTLLPSWAYTNRPVAREGEKMVLECAARGNPPPKLIWFKGGGGSNLPPPEGLASLNDVNFDVGIREALNYLPLTEATKYLGTKVAEDDQLFPAIMEAPATNNLSDVKLLTDMEGANLTPRESDFTETRLDRFSVEAGLRKDDTGVPVIAVSRLIVDDLGVSDATRYTCLAQLDMEPLGGHGNWTDVGSLLPSIILLPQFVAAGTKLYATGNPGENATLTCEALGGLSIPGGLQLTLLRGSGLKELAEQAISAKGSFPPSTLISDSPVESSTFAEERERLPFSERIETILPDMDPRYHLIAGPDPRNPYAAMVRLTITNLRPEDNNYYVCKAQSGDNWIAYAPSPENALGRLSVWFAPPKAGPPPREGVTTTTAPGDGEGGWEVMYGLAHKPSRLECRSLGQPPPQWTWTGPAIRKVIDPVSAGEVIEADGYTVRAHQEGEESVSELILPAAYWSFGIFGSYSCTAENRLGKATGYVRLKLATHPQCPNVTACTVEATLVELCVIPPKETGGLPLTHYELRIQPSPNERFHGPFAYLPGRRVVRLPDLTPNHFYKFALSAVTSAGRGPNTYIQVMTRKIGVPKLKLIATNSDVTSSDYLVRWILESDGGSPVIMYKIKIRPVEASWGPVQKHLTPLGSWTVFDVLSRDADRRTRHGVEGMYRIKSLQPGTSYEVNLVGQNSVGQSNPYVVVLQTSELIGTSGRLLGEPISQYFHGDSVRRVAYNLVLLAALLIGQHHLLL